MEWKWDGILELPVESHVEFENEPALFEKGVEILPGLTERFGHGCVHFGPRSLAGDQLIGLFQQFLHRALLALLP